MAEEFSFDVVSKVDLQVVDECVQAALKEIVNRFDFRGANAGIELDKKAGTLKLAAADEYKVNAVFDILLARLARRGVPVRNFEKGKVEAALGQTAKAMVTIKQGIPSDKAREMAAAIKQAKLKVQPQIQGDQLRVAGRSKDDLQQAIALLKGRDWGLELQFTNYR
jgi:uncharacterized protein YajQ (UPF0234 family)